MKFPEKEGAKPRRYNTDIEAKLMDETESSRDRVAGLTEKERAQREEQARREVSRLTEDEITAYIRRNQVELDLQYIQLGAVARVIVRILNALVQGVTDVATSLSTIDAAWARGHGRELLEAIQQTKISRRNREGKMLLSLPTDRDEPAVHAEWLRSVRAVDQNSQWLSNACSYGMARLRRLETVAVEVATAMSTIEHQEAQACATRLQRLATRALSSAEKKE